MAEAQDRLPDPDDDTGRPAAEAFVARWQGVTASELSTSQSFLIDLCALLGVEAPHPTPEQDYMFERPITFSHGDGSRSAGRIDLYRRGAFVLESKKLRAATHTRGFDDALLRARSQAEAYARALPAGEGRPPFVVVVDVGQRIELYAEFSRSGATYTPFPDPRSHRIALADLVRPEVREQLRRVWTDPMGLDPSRESARVTRQIAAQLAELAKRLEQAGHSPEAVAQFLMRCLFTMFAEDVGLLPNDSFKTLLATHKDQPATAMRMLAQLWRDMDSGGFSAVLANDVLQFNGKLFKHPDTLPLDAGHIGLLLDAARADWKHVEPAIFGTLLERALSPGERHKLGAHYTPRAYVERLVLPTVIEPLRKEWGDARAAALMMIANADLARETGMEATGRKSQAERLKQYNIELRKARDILLGFHKRLCRLRVLDPACGSGNFLYVTLEHLKRLEGEVLNTLEEYGLTRLGVSEQTDLDVEVARAISTEAATVDPHNLLGIEINPRAAAIAEVVLWIGYLQWHFRTRGDVRPPQPVIRDFRNIENRDAVLAYDRVEFVLGDDGKPVTRWDGVTMKPSPVTGEPIPDDSARMPLERYVNPRKAQWPEADFVVGNPPFIGNKRMRTALGDGYVEALRKVWRHVPATSDFVLYWWSQAADLTRAGDVERFGFITTNSVRQVQGRRATEKHLLAAKSPLTLVFAIPDHPWVDSADGAAVRVSMTVGALNEQLGVLLEVESESDAEEGVGVSLRARQGRILPDLRVGADVAGCASLLSNESVCFQGYILVGEGFILDPIEERRIRAVKAEGSKVLRVWKNGRDFAQSARGHAVIDLFGLTLADVQKYYPAIYQHVLTRVKPFREQTARRNHRENWWIWGESRPGLRLAQLGLDRVIVTNFAAKHRFFVFEGTDVALDHNMYMICTQDEFVLGVLSSTVHRSWMLAAGGTLEDRPTWTNSTCFEPFAFPCLALSSPSGQVITSPLVAAARGASATEDQSQRLRSLAAQLDAHRKTVQTQHPGLTLTGMYNVLEKLRSGEPLTAKERIIHEQGLVSVLRQIHDELDAAVLEAYGWSDLLPLVSVAHGNDPPADGQTREEAKRAFDEAVLERLVALNAERAAEEARGLVRWLRPEFQNPGATQAPEQGALVADEDDDKPAAAAAAAVAAGKPKPWPKDPIDQVRAVADLIAASPVPLSMDEIGDRFSARGPWKRRLPGLLEMLVALGRAQEQDGRYAAA